MRVRIHDKPILENVSSVEIVNGENCLFIESDQNHPERNFDIQTVTVVCGDCGAFHDEDCFCVRE